METCKEVFLDPYDGSPKLKCDLPAISLHRFHLDKVLGVEWRKPFEEVGVTRLTPKPPKKARMYNETPVPATV